MMRQRGDTIVEVLFAVTVFSLIAVGGLSLMNQGAAMAQRSLEIGLVRDQMDAQADALRFMHNAYVASFGQGGAVSTDIWKMVTTQHAVTKAQAFSDTSNGRTCRLPGNDQPYDSSSDGAPFAIDVRKLDGIRKADGSIDSPILLLSQGRNIDQTDTYSQVLYKNMTDPAIVQGIWVQAVKSPSVGDKLGYYDFHIRACWLTPGQLAPVTLGTIVRLYEP